MANRKQPGNRNKRRGVAAQRAKPEPNEVTQVTRMEAIAMQGPLPPPAILADYNAIVPDAAERILAMAERQNEHRISMEAGLLDHQTRNEKAAMSSGEFMVSHRS